jgi:hypothetical protein
VLADRSELEDALRVSETVPDARARAAVLMGVLEKQIAAGDSKAEETRARIDSALADITDDNTAIYALVRLADAERLAEPGRAREALERAERLLGKASSSVGRWLLQEVAEAWIRLGDVQQAMSVVEAAEGVENSHDAVLRVAETFATSGIPDAAASLFRLARVNASRAKDARARDSMLGSLAQAQVGVGQFADALETAAGATSAVTRVEVFAAIARSEAATEGRPSAATLEQALASARTLDDDYSRMSAYREIARTWAEAGDTQSALAVARELRDPDEEKRIEVKDALANGDLDAALGHIDGIRYDGYADEALREAIASVLATGDLERASRLARRVRQPHSVGFVLEAIATRAVADGEFDYALAAANQITSEDTRSRVLARIATAQAEAGRGEQAVRTTELIRVNRADCLVNVGAALLKANDEHVRQLLAEAAQYPDSAYGFCALLAKSYPDHAEEIAAFVREPGANPAAMTEATAATGYPAPAKAHR